MKKRIFSLTLAACLLTSALAGCAGEASGTPQTTSGGAAESETTVPVTTEEVYPYPASGFGGEDFNILNVEDQWYMHCVMTRAEMTGEQLDDAVYQRNSTVEDKLGVTFKETLTKNLSAAISTAKSAILAGDDVYNITNQNIASSTAMITDGCFHNLADIDSLSLDRRWWYSSYNDQVTLNGALYGAMGGLNMMVHDAIYLLAFNGDMLKSLGLNAPYDLVREGKWTFDEFHKYIAAGAMLNGAASAAWDLNARTVYGYVGSSDVMYPFFTSSGEQLVTNENGVLKLNGGSERWFNIVDKLSAILTTEDAVFYAGNNTKDADPDLGGYVYIFKNQRALFGYSQVCKFQLYRDLEFDYGIVPFPKYDEQYDEYTSTCTPSTSSVFIPITNADPEKTGLVMDALSFESEKSVIPIFREVTLETKGLRDDDSIEMLGVIMESIVPYFSTFGVSTTMMNALQKDIVEKNGKAASTYAEHKTSIETQLAQVMQSWKAG